MANALNACPICGDRNFTLDLRREQADVHVPTWTAVISGSVGT